MATAESTARLGMRHRFRWLSLTPFDQKTAEGRGDERHRRVALSAAASALAKMVSVSTALISIPLTLHYLGPERFGLWMIVSSLIAMLSFADLGISNGVLSSVAAAHGKDNVSAIQRIVASGFFLLTLIGCVLMLLFCAAYGFVPWPAVFNVQSAIAGAEAGPATAVFVACFAASVPLALVQRVQMGLQHGFVASLWQCFGSLSGLVGVLVVIQLEGGLPWLVLAMAGAPLLAALSNSLHFYFRTRPDLRPRWAAVSGDTARQIAGTGMLFFVLQIAVAVTYMSDSIVIAQSLGASAVASYAVPEKLFGVVTLILAMLLAPLWPAYGEAIARGDSLWVRRTFIRSTLLVLAVGSVTSAILFVAAPHLLELWVGNAMSPPLSLLAALAVWRVIETVGNSVAMFLNGAHVVRLQVVVALTTAVAAIAMKLLLVPIMGVAGAVWATIVAYLLFAVVPYAVILPRMAVFRSGAR